MNQISQNRQFDLEERTLIFAKKVRRFLKKIPCSLSNTEDIKQLVRSSGSVAANYIEANESLGKKDFAMKAKTSKREAKESRLWLQLVDVGNHDDLEQERSELVQEAKELTLIFAAIVRKSTIG